MTRVKVRPNTHYIYWKDSKGNYEERTHCNCEIVGSHWEVKDED